MADCVLPEDILFSCILTRLPVKSILRFKSVCKPWLQLLSTPKFVKLHHAQFSCDPKNVCFVIDLDPILLFKVGPSTILDLPGSFSTMSSVGCCNGLICLGHWHGKDNIILWNPALKLFKSIGLSKYEEHPTRIERQSLGFGYDAELDDYKLVRIVNFEVEVEEWDMDMVMEEMDKIEVYSVNSDSWITIDPGFQIHTLNDKSNATVDGNPYWVAEVCEFGSPKNNSYDVLVYFDVKKMVFKTVPLFKPTISGGARFVDWNGCLGALVCTEDNERVVISIDVWVFDEGEQIWRKHRTFKPFVVWMFDEGEQIWREHCSFGGAPFELKNLVNWGWKLLCSKNGKIMFMGPDDQMFVFDSDIGSVKEVDMAEPRRLDPYTESLAYIEGMEGFIE